jgi:D-alanyl-D-alanine carboxypeptidase
MGRRPMVTRTTLAAVLVAGAALVACGSDDDAGGADSAPTEIDLVFELPTAEMSEEDAAALMALPLAIDPTALGSGEAPGYLRGVWDPERGVDLAGAGLAEIAGDRAMSPDDSFRIGSITKTFTATAVLLLVDDGDVDLDEPVATYTGDLTAALPGGDAVTVRQALGMQTGWPEYTNNPAGPFGEAIVDPTKEFTAEDLVAAAAAEAPTPADKVTYVNTNYIVLGELVEQVSGTSFGEFVRERILDPLGLENTEIPDQTDTAEPTSHGYLNDDWADFGPEYVVPDEVLAAGGSGTDVTELSTSVGGTAGNGVSTLGDLARWAAADFGNVLLSDESRAARLDAAPSDDILPGTGYGLGLQVLGDWHFHEGEIFGWESQLWANPITGQVVALNANACCGLLVQNLLLVTGTFPDDPDLAALDASIMSLIGGG